MTLRDFIRSNRPAIDAAIRTALSRPELRLNDRYREAWILNDEGLYDWARSCGVRV